MKLQGRNLRLDLRGADVRLLQFELRLLGLDIPDEEALNNHFGKGTQEAVLEFQRGSGELQPTGIVEPATAKRINAGVRERVPVDEALGRLIEAVKRTLEQIGALDFDQPDLRAEIRRNGDALRAFAIALDDLRERDAPDDRIAEIEGMLDAAHAKLKELADAIGDDGSDNGSGDAFAVSGRVRQRDGAPIIGARVRVLEKRVVTAQNRILGNVRSDEAGVYQLAYHAEGNARPDLVVEVLAQQGGEVVTRSPLIVDAAAQQTVDLVVDNAAYPPASEFERIEARLAPLLDGETFNEIDSDSVSYLSGKTGISPVRLSEFVQAQRFAQNGEVPAQVYYGLFRANLPVNKPALVAQDNALLTRAISATSTANVIDPALAQQPDAIEQAVGTLNREMVDTIVEQPMLPNGEASLGAFLDIAALDEEQKRTVVEHVQSTTSRGDDFWNGLAEQGVEARAVESMKLTAQLGTLTLNNAPLMRTLHEQLRDRIGEGEEPLRALVGLTQDDWLGLVRDHTDANGDVIVPDPVPTADDQEPEITYARTMTRVVEDAYPTPTLVARAGADGFVGAAALTDFLAEHADFELRDSSVPAYLRANEINLDGETQKTLERVGRVFELAPRFDRHATVRPLLDANIDSAYQVRTMGERRFVRRFRETLGEDEARQVYAVAARKTATATALFAQHAAVFNNINLAAVPQIDAGSIFADILDPPPEYIDFPTWEDLFGNLDFCDCEHCNSVYSPAAYLVALLKFLRDRGALGALFARRPDIGHVELTCHNTNTTLPYVDLVLEVLETFLVEGDDVHQTEGEAPALRVHPEHINAEAYRILEEDRVYPWSLPFSLWTEEARAYLGPLGVARHEILNHFNPTTRLARDVDDWLPVATEHLNLTSATRAILLDTSFDAERWNGRNANALRTVQTLIDTAGIHFLELRQLLGTRFIDPDGALDIDFAVSEGDEAGIVCDLEQATVNGLTRAHLNRLQRFVRLRRALGWSVHELDAVLQALGGNLDTPTLVALAFVQTLHERLDASLLVIASWVADLDTHDYLTDNDETARSFYASLFLNRTVGADEELAPFELDALDGNASLDDHEAAVLAALQIITSEELALIRERRLDSDGLTLANLSELHRVATLKRALKLSVGELLDLLGLSGLNPFDTATLYDGVRLLDLVETLETTEFSVAELNYLLRHFFDANSPVAPTESQISPFLEGLRGDLQRVRSDFAAAPDPTGELTAQMLAIVLIDDALSTTLSLLYGVAPAEDLPTNPPAFLDEQLAHFVTDDATRREIVTQLLDEDDAAYLQPEVHQAERFALVLEPLVAHLRAINSVTLVQQHFADFLALDLDASGLLLGGLIRSVADSGQPASALFLSDVFVESEDEITADTFAGHFAMTYRLHKVALLIERFDLPTEELAWLVEQHATIEWLNFNDLPVAETANAGARWAQWLRMAQASVLHRAWPAGEPTLFALLRQAENGGDAAAFDAFLGALTERTAWNRADVDTLVHATRFDLDDFDADWGGAATLAHLWRLHECFGLLRRLGVSATMAWDWTAAPVTRKTAGEVKQAARAKFSESQWLNVAEPIRDGLRQRQRDTLVDAVIQQLDDPLIRDSNDLYARFLMDAEINPCMLTSRIVFATAAVQLFVQRVLLNLEDEVNLSTEDAEMWQWMKNYRVWEANVKVFVTPENWIEPELRPEKSPAFIDLENELLQNDVTLETVEVAYQNYLEKLDEVARLEVVGVYNENDTGTLHVIGRTKGTPHKYFYRQWFEARRWTPWQEVPVDIEGETITPVIYNRRLYLFWFAVIEKAEEEAQGEQLPNRYLEIKLAWSQYRQRKWSPKRISTAPIETTRVRSDKESMLDPAGYRPRPIIRPNGDLFVAIERSSAGSLSSFLDSNKLNSYSGFLFINDGQIELSSYNSPRKETVLNLPVENSRSWSYYFSASGTAGMKVRGWDGSGQAALDKLPYSYRVTVPLQYSSFNSDGPLFFEDRDHTYFVTPHHIWGPHPAYTDDLAVAFPNLNVYLEREIPLRIEDILGPIVPGDVDPLPIRPSLESVLYPETHTPAVEVAISDTIATIDRRLLGQPTLSVVRGGAAITGGDVGVPIVGLNGVSGVRTHFTGAPIAPLMARATPDGALADSIRRTDTLTRSTNELVVANTLMTLGAAESVWSVWLNTYLRTEYTFYSFYHPYVDSLIEQLNRYGVAGILNPREGGEAHDLRRQLMQEPDNEQFDDTYDLGDDINDAEGMLPVEEFVFEYGRAYSVYNWELFFHIPFMIANHLSQNQRFEEAQKWYHFIFDPTDRSDVPEELDRYRFWKVKPFYENTDIQTIEQLMRLLSSNDPADVEMKRRLEDQIEDWRANPFQPHLIAEQRPVAYQKAIVMKYLDNLIAWGDYLFRLDTRESVFEAIQIYILAAEILGKEPVRIPSLEGERTIDGEPVRTFNDLAPHLDEFGNTLVRLETELAGRVTPTPNSLGFPTADDFTTANPTGPQPDFGLPIEPPTHEIIGSTLFFCIPPNEKLFGYWGTVADRLFKIRNCMNIEGVVRQLDLFAPPIDPALLVRAAAAGLDLGSVLNDLNAPNPHYRFSVMIGKALELCNDVKALGSALLQALEKRDAEELSLLRQTHEQNLLQAVKLVRERQVEEAEEALAGLEKNLESAEARQQFYANRNPLIPNEKLHLTKMETAGMFDGIAQGFSLVGSALALIPEFDLGAEGGFSSPTVKAQFGGSNLSKVLSFYSQMYSFFGSLERQGAQRASILAGYDRRQEEWDFSAEQARIDSEGIERQIAAAKIRMAVAEQELANQDLQIEQSRESDEFMRYKFTNHDLYSWMVSQISALYFQAYQLAYDVAKRAERAFQHELADGGATFINFGYWDSLKKGLLAGERLSLDLRRMETAYMERNKRELELTKHVSLRRLDPAALIQLRETGSCEVEIPEALFNLDFPGHYLRRLKTVSLTIPSVVGPYTGVNATLTLLSNRTRVNTVDPHVPYAGVEDARFTTNVGGIQAIAASNGREDSGLFELNLRDERYLPFEGAGAIGRWRIDLNDEYRAFDYDTISDVILHLRYTARDGGAAVGQQVVPALADRVNELINATEHTGLFHFISLQREFSGELHRFLYPTGADDHDVTLTLRRDHYPYLFQGRTLTVNRALLLLKLHDGSLFDDDQPLAVELSRADGDLQSVDLVTAGDLLGGLPLAEYAHVAGEIVTEEAWRLRVSPAAVQALPDELHQIVEVDGANVPRLRVEQFEDIGLLVHYNVG